MTGIYMIWFDNDKFGHCYIGQSVNIEKRRREHRYELKAGIHVNKYMQHVYDKYGKESMHFELLCECEENKLDEMEEYYIHELNCFSVDYPEFGLNLTTGGQGVRHLEVSEDTRIKHSVASRNMWKNDNTREKILNSLQLTRSTDEYKNKQRENTKKRFEDPDYKRRYLEFRRSDEFRKHMSDIQKGKRLPEEVVQKLINNKLTSKPVYCVELDKVFPSQHEAQRFLFDEYHKHINLSPVINGKKSTAGGFHWERYSQP